MKLGRDDILDALRAQLEAIDDVHAMWEAGSKAFGRVDEWSDLDLVVECEDAAVESVLERCEAALEKLSPIELRWRVPEPTWHGSSQVFYRLRDAGAYLMIDLCVMKHSSERRFREVERHGEAVTIFDKHGCSQHVQLDAGTVARANAERLGPLCDRFEMFQNLVTKNVARDKPLEAIAFYHSQTLRPLVQLLRMKHAPARWDFGLRLAHFDFPEDVAAELAELHMTADLEDLVDKHRRAVALFRKIRDELR